MLCFVQDLDPCSKRTFIFTFCERLWSHRGIEMWFTSMSEEDNSMYKEEKQQQFHNIRDLSVDRKQRLRRRLVGRETGERHE